MKSGRKAKVTIIGGGPAGLMAADVLSAAGHEVTIYDRMPSLGRKFLLAGRGGLNITHSEPFDTFISRYGKAQAMLAPGLQQFSPEDMRAFCAALGQNTFTGSSGRVFPASFKTSPLLRAWLRKLAQQGVEVRLRHAFTGWEDANTAVFSTASGERLSVPADATILALGGASWPRLGSDGTWTQTLTQRNIAVTPLRASNSGFVAVWPPGFGERFAGTPLKSIAITVAEQKFHGECIVTQTGLEGGVIYTISAQLRDAIEANGEANISIDFKPGLSENTLAARIEATPRKQSLANRLRKAARLPPVTVALLRAEKQVTSADELASLIKNYPVRLVGVQPIARAISTAGGLSFDELDPNMMVKKMPCVFAAGEMLDWEAPTGGYLLQACFSTGVAAARGALQWLETQENPAQ